MHSKTYYTFKSLQNKSPRCFTSTRQNDAMPRFNKTLFFCPFNDHYDIRKHNPVNLQYTTPYKKNSLYPFKSILLPKIKLWHLKIILSY